MRLGAQPGVEVVGTQLADDWMGSGPQPGPHTGEADGMHWHRMLEGQICVKLAQSHRKCC